MLSFPFFLARNESIEIGRLWSDVQSCQQNYGHDGANVERGSSRIKENVDGSNSRKRRLATNNIDTSSTDFEQHADAHMEKGKSGRKERRNDVDHTYSIKLQPVHNDDGTSVDSELEQPATEKKKRRDKKKISN